MLHNCQIWGHTFTCGISSNLLLSSFCPEFTFSDHFRGPCLLLSYGPHSARSLVLFNLCTYPARIWGEMGEYTNCRKKAWFSPFLQQQTPTSKPPRIPRHLLSCCVLWYPHEWNGNDQLLTPRLDCLKTEAFTTKLNSALFSLLGHWTELSSIILESQDSGKSGLIIWGSALSQYFFFTNSMCKAFYLLDFNFLLLWDRNNIACPASHWVTISIIRRVCKSVIPECFSVPMADITNRLFLLLIEPGCSLIN